MTRYKLPKKPVPQKPAAAPPARYSTRTKPESGRAAVPSLFHRQMAGVSLAEPPGPGRQRLDRVCHAKGKAWGTVATYDRNGKAVVAVLIGTIVEGEAEWLEGNAKSHGAWDVTDQAYNQIAEWLERGGDI